MKRFLSILIVLAMCLSLLPMAVFAAEEYTDIQGHWGKSAIDRWSGYGIVSGKGNGVFDPNGPMKRGEAAQVFENLFKLTAKTDLSDFTDVGSGKWYDDAIAKCVKAGIMNGKGNGVMDPEGTITREEFFVMFANALGIKPETTAEVTVVDGAQAASWAAGYINALINRGFVSGTGAAGSGVSVQPKLNINRASVMALLNKTIKTYVNTTEQVTAGDGLTLIVVDNANVTFEKGAENAEVYVFGKNAVITDAPVGTRIVTSEDATGTKVNGKALSKDTAFVVEERKSSGSSGSGSDTPATKSVAEILATVEGGFPTASGFYDYPADAWKASNGSLCYINGKALLFVTEDQSSTVIELSNNVAKSENDYVYSSESGKTVTFHMTENVLTSITFVWNSDNSWEHVFDGTYAPYVAVTGVSIKPAELKLLVNDDYNLTVAITPENATNKGVIWSSSDPEKVSVTSDGAIKALAFTTTAASITATTVDGGMTATCMVTVIAASKTVSDILATVDEFPTSNDSKPVPAPDTAWSTANGEKCYIWGNDLYFAKAEGNSVTSINKNITVEESEGNYVSAFPMQTIGNIIFNMTGNVLTGITVENYEGFNGTYTAPGEPEFKTIADILAAVEGGFPTSDDWKNPPENAWVANNGNKCYVSNEMLYFYKDPDNSSDVSISNYEVKKNGDNYVCDELNSAMTTFTMEDGKLKGIVFTSEIRKNLSGTYAPAPAATTYTVTFDLNGITGTAPEAQTIEADGKVTKPTKNLPILENHTLKWFTKDAATGKLSDEWNFDTAAVTADMTLCAQWTRTLKSILDTNPDIPAAEDNTPPDNAWINENSCKGFIAYSKTNTALYLKGNKNWACLATTFFTKVGEKYVYDGKNSGVLTLIMKDGKFTSAEFDGEGTSFDVLSGIYTAPATNLFSYIDANTALDFAEGKYGNNTIQSGNPIVINGVTGKLLITGNATDRVVHAFVQNGGYVTSSATNGTINAYIGGSEDAEGTITAGADAVTVGTDGITGVSEIFANTTGKISIGVSDYKTKIDLGSVDATIEITTPLAHNVGTSVLQLDYSTNGLFKNISSSDTLTYTAAADVEKVLGTVGNDIISMDDNAAGLTKIDLIQGGGNDTVIVNENLWKYAAADLGTYEIDVKSGDKVKIGNAASCISANVTVDSGTVVTTDNINTAINKNASESGLFFFKFIFSTSGESEFFLVYDKDKNGALSDGDIVIKIVGANKVDNMQDTGCITFIGS